MAPREMTAADYLRNKDQLTGTVKITFLGKPVAEVTDVIGLNGLTFSDGSRRIIPDDAILTVDADGDLYPSFDPGI